MLKTPQVNRKVVEPLIKIEKDMDRLEEKIQLSEKAVNQLKGDASKLDDNTVKDESENDAGVSPRKSFQSLVVVDKKNDDGCKFSKTPSGLSSDVKVGEVFLGYFFKAGLSLTLGSSLTQRFSLCLF